MKRITAEVQDSRRMVRQGEVQLARQYAIVAHLHGTNQVALLPGAKDLLERLDAVQGENRDRLAVALTIPGRGDGGTEPDAAGRLSKKTR